MNNYHTYHINYDLYTSTLQDNIVWIYQIFIDLTKYVKQKSHLSSQLHKETHNRNIEQTMIL